MHFRTGVPSKVHALTTAPQSSPISGILWTIWTITGILFFSRSDQFQHSGRFAGRRNTGILVVCKDTDLTEC